MDLIIGIIWDFAWWIIGIGVALCMLVVLFGIIKYSMAQGDPNKAAGARATMFGGAFGVVALPVALIAFRIFFGDVIAPNTGVDASFLDQNCDGVLRAQLQARGNVTTEDHAKGLISAIQTGKSDCSKDNWMNVPALVLKAGTVGAGGAGITAAACAHPNPSPTIKRAVTAAIDQGFGRVGGAIVIALDTRQAKHLLPGIDNCWIFDPAGGGWYIGASG